LISKIAESLVVSSGYPITQEVQAFSLGCCSQSNVDKVVHSYKNCTIPQFPDMRMNMFGAVVGEKIVACGGATSGSNANHCYSLGPLEKAWQFSGAMREARRLGDAIEFTDPGKIFITGGRQGKSPNMVSLKTTEILDIDSRTSTFGPDLPEGLAFHCILKLNSSTAMIIGGYNGYGVVPKTHYFDLNKLTFTPGPNLLTDRHNHACGILQTEGKEYIVVAGGETTFGGSSLASTEYLTLDNPDGWKQGE